MSKSSKTILCIDDDPSAVELRRLILLSKGYEVITATQGDEALKIFADMKVDLVISDHFSRGSTGGELASKMKAVHPDVPIILISGYPERPDSLEHADVFVVKGGPTEELLGVIAQVLDQWETEPHCSRQRIPRSNLDTSEQCLPDTDIPGGISHRMPPDAPAPDEPELNLLYDASGDLAGGVCSQCGIEIGTHLSPPNVEQMLNQFFALHLQARHPTYAKD